MILWGALIIWSVVAPWLAAAAFAAVGAWFAAREQRGMFATLAAAAVIVCGFMTSAVPGLRARQLDALHFQEATMFCSGSPVRLLRRPPTAEIKFGIYDGHLGPGNAKDVDFALRSRRTAPGSSLGSVSVVAIKRDDVPAADVYPLFRRIQQGSVNLSVVDPGTGEILAYSNYLYDQQSETRARYVGCNREAHDSPRQLEADELVALMAALVPGSQSAAPPARKRAYDIEPDTFHEVRDDCSSGLRIAPGNQYSLDYRYLRSGDDLVVLVLDRASWHEALARKSELAAANKAPILWQHFYPVITCKGYLSEDRKAGPVFHPNGYEEPVARVRGRAQSTFQPLDYGPHRELQCEDTILMGSVRPTEHYVLKREGTNLVVAAVEDLYGEPLKVTPLITCKGYFGASPNSAPDVRLGMSQAREPAFRESAYPASRVLELRDGEYLGKRGSYIAQRLKEPQARRGGASASVPTPRLLPKASAEERRSSGAPWPAKPRL